MRYMSIEEWISGRDNGTPDLPPEEDPESYNRYTRVRPGTMPYSKRPDGKLWHPERRRT